MAAVRFDLEVASCMMFFRSSLDDGSIGDAHGAFVGLAGGDVGWPSMPLDGSMKLGPDSCWDGDKASRPGDLPRGEPALVWTLRQAAGNRGILSKSISTWPSIAVAAMAGDMEVMGFGPSSSSMLNIRSV